MEKTIIEALKDQKWSHLRTGSWAGGISGTQQVLEGSQTPTVHLLRVGSNTCITGFETPEEAREFRAQAGPNIDWRVTDLRDDRPRYDRQSLDDARREKIEEIFEHMEFDYPVECANGWESDGLGRFERAVFFDVGKEESHMARFAVVFVENTPEDWVVEVPDIEDKPSYSPSP